jgi:hypothetical protein
MRPLEQLPGLRARGLSAATTHANGHRQVASPVAGGVVRCQQKGRSLKAVHAFTFASPRPVTQPVIRLIFPREATMEEPSFEQLRLAPLLARLEGPSVVPVNLIRLATTYRQAVRLCWALRRVRNMTLRQLAAEAGLIHQHVGDYLNPDDRPGRRDLPGGAVEAFECIAGNTFISQWHAMRASLTVLEQFQTEGLAA